MQSNSYAAIRQNNGKTAAKAATQLLIPQVVWPPADLICASMTTWHEKNLRSKALAPDLGSEPNCSSKTWGMWEPQGKSHSHHNNPMIQRRLSDTTTKSFDLVSRRNPGLQVWRARWLLTANCTENQTLWHMTEQVLRWSIELVQSLKTFLQKFWCDWFASTMSTCDLLANSKHRFHLNICSRHGLNLCLCNTTFCIQDLTMVGNRSMDQGNINMIADAKLQKARLFQAFFASSNDMRLLATFWAAAAAAPRPAAASCKDLDESNDKQQICCGTPCMLPRPHTINWAKKHVFSRIFKRNENFEKQVIRAEVSSARPMAPPATIVIWAFGPRWAMINAEPWNWEQIVPPNVAKPRQFAQMVPKPWLGSTAISHIISIFVQGCACPYLRRQIFACCRDERNMETCVKHWRNKNLRCESDTKQKQSRNPIVTHIWSQWTCQKGKRCNTVFIHKQVLHKYVFPLCCCSWNLTKIQFTAAANQNFIMNTL